MQPYPQNTKVAVFPAARVRNSAYIAVRLLLIGIYAGSGQAHAEAGPSQNEKITWFTHDPEHPGMWHQSEAPVGWQENRLTSGVQQLIPPPAVYHKVEATSETLCTLWSSVWLARAVMIAPAVLAFGGLGVWWVLVAGFKFLSARYSDLAPKIWPGLRQALSFAVKNARAGAAAFLHLFL